MLEFQTMFTRQRKWMFFLLSIYVLGWGFTAYQSIFLGLILGTSLSLFNLWLMARKMTSLDRQFTREKEFAHLGRFQEWRQEH